MTFHASLRDAAVTADADSGGQDPRCFTQVRLVLGTCCRNRRISNKECRIPKGGYAGDCHEESQKATRNRARRWPAFSALPIPGRHLASLFFVRSCDFSWPCYGIVLHHSTFLVRRSSVPARNVANDPTGVKQRESRPGFSTTFRPRGRPQKKSPDPFYVRGTTFRPRGHPQQKSPDPFYALLCLLPFHSQRVETYVAQVAIQVAGVH